MRRVVLLLLLLFLFIGLIGCSGKIEGTVFLDSNGDQIPDPKERSLTRLALKISQDDVVIGKTNTNLQGKYVWPFTDSGYYCVEVDEPSLQQNLMEAMSAAAPAAGSSLLKPAFSLGGTLGGIAKGMTVAMSEKAATTSTSTTPPTTTTTTGTTATTSDTKDGPVSTPPKPAVSDFGKVCDNVSGLKATFHIPVMIDYAKEVSRIPPPLKEVRRTGEKFSVEIVYPIGCTPESLYIPDGLIPYSPSVGDGYDPHVLIELKQRRRIDFVPDVTSTGISLHFQVEEEIPLGTHSVQLEPSVLCAGNVHTLHPILIDLKSEPLITVKQSLNKSRGSSGDEVEWEIIIKNEGSKKYDLDLVGAFDPILSVDFAPGSGSGCTTPGHKIECSLSLDGDASKTVKMKVTLPSITGGNLLLNFDASVKVDLYEEEIEAEGAEFTLVPVTP